MHHIYHTDAFVLGSRPHGEDSKTLMLYTRELGLVYARAQGLRKISSKLRYVLQDFSRTHVDLVRGKEVWRVTTAVPPALPLVREHGKGEAIIARICALLIRLVPGEEANEEVFEAVARAYDLLLVSTRTPADYRMVELLSVARILVALGYLPREMLKSSAAESEDIPEAFADVSYQHKLIRDINMALSASQL